MKRIASSIILLFIFFISVCNRNSNTNFEIIFREWNPALFGEGSVIEGPYTIEEIEEKELDEIKKCNHCPQVPFGYSNNEWNDFKQKIKKNDQLLFFSSDNKSWSGLCGREGYAIIRDNKIVDTFITLIN